MVYQIFRRRASTMTLFVVVRSREQNETEFGEFRVDRGAINDESNLKRMNRQWGQLQADAVRATVGFDRFALHAAHVAHV